MRKFLVNRGSRKFDAVDVFRSGDGDELGAVKEFGFRYGFVDVFVILLTRCS